MLTLPGIGKYTARALLCFAFDHQVAVLDTNIKKVILTQFVKKQHLEEKELEKIALTLLPKGKAYEWNQALMDYAAAKLKKEKIRIPKQSKFINSDRYIRGTIIKLLLTSSPLSQNKLYEQVMAFKKIDHQKFLTLVGQLKKDGLITQKRQMIMLP
jgi:A/G-specific adenine glycosylase